jgi:hypothetical protein
LPLVVELAPNELLVKSVPEFPAPESGIDGGGSPGRIAAEVEAGRATGVSGSGVDDGGGPSAFPAGVLAGGLGVLSAGLVAALPLLPVDDVLLLPADELVLLPVDDVLLLPADVLLLPVDDVLLLPADDVLLLPADELVLLPVDDVLSLSVDDVVPAPVPEVVPGLGIEAQNAWTVSPLVSASARKRESTLDERGFPRVVVLDALESGATYAVHSPYRFAVVVGAAAVVGDAAVVGEAAVAGNVALLLLPPLAPALELAPPEGPAWVFEPRERPAPGSGFGTLIPTCERLRDSAAWTDPGSDPVAAAALAPPSARAATTPTTWAENSRPKVR